MRFLGFTAYYWGDNQRRAIHTLKALLMQKPFLQLFRDDGETELHTDASAEEFAAILFQRSEEDNELHSVYHLS